MNVATDERPEFAENNASDGNASDGNASEGKASESGASQTADDAQFGAALAAGVGLFAALRKIAAAVAALLAAEARVLRASVAMVFIAGVALIALAVSLWACAVALIGWGVAVATGSLGISLGVLVVLHMILLAAIWFWIKRAIRRASFPAVRVELRALRHALRRDVARFQNAQTSPDSKATP